MTDLKITNDEEAMAFVEKYKAAKESAKKENSENEEKVKKWNKQNEDWL